MFCGLPFEPQTGTIRAFPERIMSDNLIACDVGGWIAKTAAVGQRVDVGDPLLVVRTGDSDVVLDAPIAGRVKTMFFARDEMLPEAAVVAVIEA